MIDLVAVDMDFFTEVFTGGEGVLIFSVTELNR